MATLKGILYIILSLIILGVLIVGGAFFTFLGAILGSLALGIAAVVFIAYLIKSFLEDRKNHRDPPDDDIT